MRMKLVTAAVVVVASLAFAADGGVKLPKSTSAEPVAAADAGVARPKTATTTVARDGGTPSAAQVQAAALEEQKKQNQELKKQVNELSEQLSSLRKELDEAKATKQRDEQAAQQKAQQIDQTVQSLAGFDQQLNFGDTRGVDQALVAAGANLGPSGKANIDAARNALKNSDLSAARAFMRAAILDAQSGR